MNTSVSLHWAVPQTIWDKEVISLTWSATILQIGWKRFLIDLWLFQWWEASDLFNKENIDFLKNIDWVIITHWHIDHIWRLPLLAKMWYKWAIYMTPATKSIAIEMLLDSLKIQESEIIENLAKNKKLWFRLKEALKIQNLLTSSQNRLSNSSKKYLEKTLWTSYDQNQVLFEIQEYLDYYKVKNESDIKSVIDRIKEKLFDEDDLQAVMDLINSMDYSEEKVVSSSKVNSKNKNREDQDLLDNLPLKILNWFDWYVSVDSRSEKSKLKQKWEDNLTRQINNAIENHSGELEEKRDIFKKQLEAAFTYCEKYSYLDDDEFKEREEYKLIKKDLKNNRKILKKYGIETRYHIENVINDDELVVDVLKIAIDYNSEDITRASLKLEVTNENNGSRNITGISLFDAAHIVGSASVIITSWEVRWKVDRLLDINGHAVTACFTGDLWRINDNRLWRPEIPPLPVDYLQIESTYWGKNHVDRQKAIEELTKSIKDSKWDVLISVFSQQRLQEILLTIIKEKVEKWQDFLDHEILIDAPLGQKITNIYINHMWEVFDLLKAETQIKVFWKEIFRFLEFWEFEELYEKDIDWKIINNKKRIILASSWMMDGWAIMNHLPIVLQNPDATILAPWYLSKWTIWNDIVFWESKTVTIAWEKYEKKCTRKYIDWFSSHIWHDEILQYITESIEDWKIKKNATIALNHGNIEGQELLKKDIEEILKAQDRIDIKVTIPELYSEYCIKTGETQVLDKAKQIARKASKIKKVSTPSFLSKIKYEEPKEEREETLSIEEQKIRHSNTKTIEEIKNKWSEIYKQRTSYIQSYLSKQFESNWINVINSSLREIFESVSWQKKIVFDRINKKLIRNRALKNRISKLKNQKKSLKTEVLKGIIENYTLLYNFFIEEEESSKREKAKTFTNRIQKSFNNLCNNKEIKDKCSSYIDDFYNGKLKDPDTIEDELIDLIEVVLSDIYDEISITEAELESDFKISLKPKEINFNWRNLFNELYETNIEYVNIELLKELLSKWLFNEQELDFINQKLDIIETNNKNNRKTKVAEKKLKAFFKEKEYENNNLWTNLNISFDQLHKDCLKLLSRIFEKDYFENFISVQFNIYLFLKSNSSFREYIESKFDLEKLKWIKTKLKSFDEILDKLEHQKSVLNWLDELNLSTRWEESLQRIEHLIDLTAKEIDDIIKI